MQFYTVLEMTLSEHWGVRHFSMHSAWYMLHDALLGQLRFMDCGNGIPHTFAGKGFTLHMEMQSMSLAKIPQNLASWMVTENPVELSTGFTEDVIEKPCQVRTWVLGPLGFSPWGLADLIWGYLLCQPFSIVTAQPDFNYSVSEWGRMVVIHQAMISNRKKTEKSMKYWTCFSAWEEDT